MTNLLLEGKHMLAIYEFILGATFMGIFLCGMHLMFPNLDGTLSSQEKKMKVPYYRQVGALAFFGWALTIIVGAVMRLYIPYGSGSEEDMLDTLFEMMEIPLIGAIPYSLIHQERSPWMRLLVEELPFFGLFVLYMFCPVMEVVFADVILVFIYVAVATFFTIYQGKRFYKKLHDTYSNTDRRDINWLWRIVVYLLVIFVLFAVTNYVQNRYVLMAYVVITFCCLYNIYAFLTRQQPVDETLLNMEISTTEEKIMEEVEESIGIGMNDETRELLQRKLQQLIEDEKVYLDADLTVRTLADRMDTNTRYLSYIISKSEGMNFSTFINNRRIRYAQDLLTDQLELSIEEVAWKSGFTSLGNYHRLFKQITGVTPRQYREKNKKRNQKSGIVKNIE